MQIPKSYKSFTEKVILYVTLVEQIDVFAIPQPLTR